VLSNHFAEVTIIEKDTVHRRLESLKGQPQPVTFMVCFLPDLISCLITFPVSKKIIDHGASVVDFAESRNWFSYGDLKNDSCLTFRECL
jgi:hypothetical protein